VLVQISPNIIVLVAELGLKGSIPSLLCGVGTYSCTYSGSKSRSCYILLVAIELEILAPSWAIFDDLAHLIFALAWERYVVLH
jgi:hypothetical protein